VAIYCMKCGKELPDDAAFCAKCGHPQSAASVAPRAASRPQVELCEIKAVKTTAFMLIRCWQFQAAVIGPRGVYIAAKSEKFSPTTYNYYELYEEQLETLILQRLINQLVLAGWEPVMQSGVHWYSKKFQRQATSAAIGEGATALGAVQPESFHPSRRVTLLLCLFGGWLGLHRFYTGHTVIAPIQMFTLGGFFLWWLIDLVLILTGVYKDSSGRPLRRS
jgi:hypothetical protein